MERHRLMFDEIEYVKYIDRTETESTAWGI